MCFSLYCLAAALLVQAPSVRAVESSTETLTDAWIELCDASLAIRTASRERAYLQIDGGRRWLRISDHPSPGCERQLLGTNPEDVRWFGLIPAEKARWLHRGVVLQGLETAEGTQISDVEVAMPSAGTRNALPLASNLLDRLHPTIYGTESRATLVTEGEGLVLSCESGERPAGLVLRNDGARLPGAIELSVVTRHRSDSRFAIAYADAPDYPLAVPSPRWQSGFHRSDSLAHAPAASSGR